MHRVFFGLIAIPLIELWVLIAVGAEIGALTTVVLCVLTAMAGIYLLRYQGFSLMRQVDEKVARGEAPAQEMIEGVMMAFGGVLLLFPGFVSDALGFALILPFTRRFLVSQFTAYFAKKASYVRTESVIIEGEYVRNDHEKLK